MTESVEVRDNIISALFKLIMRDENKVIPLETALQKTMTQLPFKGDKVE